MKLLVNVVFNVNGNETGAYAMNCIEQNRSRRIRIDGQAYKEYIFAAYEDLSEGDVVVVDTVNGFQLATVTSIADRLPDNIPVGKLKEVVCKVDMSAYLERIENQKKAAELKSKMDEKVKVLQSQAIYEMLAEKDPSLKAMLDEYKKLMEV